MIALAGCEFQHGQLDNVRDDGRPTDAPADAAITSATLFVTDFVANKVYRYSIGANVATQPPPFEFTATSPLAPILWPPTGELFVTQATSAVVSRFAMPLGVPTLNGSFTGAGIGSQPHMMVIVDNELWISNPSGANIDRITLAGSTATMAGAIPNVTNGRGLAFDPITRDLYASECCNTDKVLHYSVAADRTVTAHPMIDGPANTHGIALAPWGEVFVVGAGSASIGRYLRDANGNLTPNGTITGNGMSTPVGIVLAPWRELYVVNQGSQTISRFKLDANHVATANGSFAVPGGSAPAWALLVY